MAANKTRKSGYNMGVVLIRFAIIPLVISVTIVSTILATTSSKELKETTYNSFVALIKDKGESFDYVIENNEDTLKTFAESPVVLEYLKNPGDANLQAKAQAYTLDFFADLKGWEGLYIADWDTKTLTHSNESTIGLVLREGDRLTSLRDSLLAAKGGVFNTGIITSPASGQIVMSLYTPVMDGDEPIGFVGGAFLVNEVADRFSDVSSLNLSSSYVYFVAPDGTMLYHPDESKIGNPVENEAVKNILARLEKGEHPDPECVEYKYKGAQKYAAYYVGASDKYITILTADEADVMANINNVIVITIILAVVCVLVFVVLAIILSKVMTAPLRKVTEAIVVLSTGNVAVECNTSSVISEVTSILDAFFALKEALMSSMGKVKESADVLNEAIVSVDSMTGYNVESISQISNAIDEVASTSQTVAESAQDMAEKAGDLGMNIETLNSNVTNLYESSNTIKSVNRDATECMKAVYEGANESVDAVQSIATKISETNTAIEDIDRAILAIESIASQTNLLSLNASIEAARAGEAGRGFAVVADEIRSLADSSAESAKEIKQIIQNVVSLSNDTVEISNRVYDVICKEQSDIQTAQNQFNVLSDAVEASISEIDTIKQMSVKLTEIKTEIADATSDLGAMSEQLGAAAQEVAASCQTVTSACTDTQASTEEMRAINEHMTTAIDFFKLQ